MQRSLQQQADVEAYLADVADQLERAGWKSVLLAEVSGSGATDDWRYASVTTVPDPDKAIDPDLPGEFESDLTWSMINAAAVAHYLIERRDENSTDAEVGFDVPRLMRVLKERAYQADAAFVMAYQDPADDGDHHIARHDPRPQKVIQELLDATMYT